MGDENWKEIAIALQRENASFQSGVSAILAEYHSAIAELKRAIWRLEGVSSSFETLLERTSSATELLRFKLGGLGSRDISRGKLSVKTRIIGLRK